MHDLKAHRTESADPTRRCRSEILEAEESRDGKEAEVRSGRHSAAPVFARRGGRVMFRPNLQSGSYSCGIRHEERARGRLRAKPVPSCFKSCTSSSQQLHA